MHPVGLEDIKQRAAAISTSSLAMSSSCPAGTEIQD
jgi:hypothetical protein